MSTKPTNAAQYLGDEDTHCHDDDTGRDVWSYSREAALAAVQRALAARERDVQQAVLAQRERAYMDVIRRLNGNPYSLTKYECLDEIEAMRRTVAAPQQAAPATDKESLTVGAAPDTRKPCTCDGAGRGPGRACAVAAGGRLGELWRCCNGLEQAPAAEAVQPERLTPFDAVARAMDKASLLAGAVAASNAEKAEFYAARLREHLIQHIYPAQAEAVPAQATCKPALQVGPAQAVRNFDLAILERASEMLTAYAELILRDGATHVEEHHYVPDVRWTAGELRGWAANGLRGE